MNMVDLEDLDRPSDQPLLVLTPPKLITRKRNTILLKPDLSIELSDMQWKRQRLDVTAMVVKRPALPLLEVESSTPVCLFLSCHGRHTTTD